MSKASIASAFLSCTVLCGAAAAAPPSGTFQLLYSFAGGSDGSDPFPGLLNVGGTLYGVTKAGGANSSGTVFTVVQGTGAEAIVHSFDPATDGAQPKSGLILDGALLYGATTAGGATHKGTVFSLNPATGNTSVVHPFGGQGSEPGGLLQIGAKIYGTTLSGPGKTGYGTVFSLKTATGKATPLTEFSYGEQANPNFGLVDVGGILYGASLGSASGSVFAVSLKTHAQSVLYTFKTTNDARLPLGSPINVAGTLYGTTYYGGAEGYGAIYSIDIATGAESVVYSFTGGNDGAGPEGALLSFQGKLYGTTSGGGGNNACEGEEGCGTIFVLDPANGHEKVLHAFSDGDGYVPNGGMIEVGGTLYGTASYGGSTGNGTVFSYTP